MTKFLKNLYRLILIGTPFFIISNYIKNFSLNYKTKKKSKKIENTIYDSFQSVNYEQKWFCNNLNYLTVNFKNIKNVKNMLEIGSYEGRSAIFFLKNFSNSNITCVDTWSGSDEHKSVNFELIEKNFDLNTLFYQSNNLLTKHKMKSNEFFKTNHKYFDLIYVDGDHSSDQVKIDLINSWNILNKDGFLVLDDYMWWHYKDLKKNPSTPINNFIEENISNISKLIVWHQVIIQKA
tara:strand:+ start:859 stop:1563 length:705 start_codon:yes stop_codon:yes gene_type:complete